MMQNKNTDLNMKLLIQEKYKAAMAKMDGKKDSEALINEALTEISELLEHKIIFKKLSVADQYGSRQTDVYVQNKENKYEEFVFSYEFETEKIFPVRMSYVNIITSFCSNVPEVATFMKEMISEETFMIKIIRVSEAIENPFNSDDDIPF